MSKIDLSKISTDPPKDADKEAIKAATEKLKSEIADLQNLMFAEGKWALLVVLQGPDASGKTGAIKVFGEVHPMGIKVKSFKKPSTEEASHDYLWRVHKETPAKGMIQVFDRSHYEEVLITRVNGWVSDETAQKRFRHLNEFERLLNDCGTKVLKFYLHVAEEERQKRFFERLTEPAKNWKYSPEDLTIFKQWPQYQKAYEDVLENCGPDNPWHIVPSDKNWYKEYFIALKTVETMRSLNMKYPQTPIDMNNPDVQELFEKFGNNSK
ncbi:MAG TPA: polyphosphate kinase [Chitinophagales bacterium]|nr:polyphosphate kinase [Chitinophagales bacterium]HRK28982.1 polyphosphate kinase [Chitinophagales bacterium]